MSKVKRLLKIGILFVLFIILAFIIVLAIFSILGKYNLFNNISKMIYPLETEIYIIIFFVAFFLLNKYILVIKKF